MAEHVSINAAQGSFSRSVLSINLKVDSGCKLYGFPLDAKRDSQGRISAHYPKLNPSYATYLDDTQQILSISLGAIPEEIHFIKAYTEDKQGPFIDQLKSIQLSYRAEGMEEMKTLSDICVGANNSHALTLGKKDGMWRFWFGDCEDFDKHE
jgi:hypothetical protein